MARFSIPRLLYEEDSFGVFVLVTVVLGGGAAWLAGRAIARPGGRGGRSSSTCCILGAAVRFIHFALFDGTLLSLHYYLVDTRGLHGIRLARLPRRRAPRQMVTPVSLDQRAGRRRCAGAASRR